MTEQELEVIKLKLRLEAASVCLLTLSRSLALHFPAFGERLSNDLKTLSQENAHLVFKSMKPEYSDMLASEYQDALNKLISDMQFP